MKRIASILCLFALSTAPALAFDFSFFWEGFGPMAEEVPPGVTLQRLATMTSDRDRNVHYLNLMIDDKNLVAGLFNESDPKNKPSDDDLRGEHVFWLRDIESEEGVVLAVAKGRKALILRGLLDRESQEGRFTIKYLANGLTMRYESCDFELKRKENSWVVKNVYTGGEVTTVHVETKMLGIATLKGLCPNK